MAANNNNVDVFVGNDTLIDPDIYQLWLNGHTGYLMVSSTNVTLFSGDAVPAHPKKNKDKQFITYYVIYCHLVCTGKDRQ